ncbi:MAG: hypothetical protein SGPRY_004152, partial [Prymnesium sp.]
AKLRTLLSDLTSLRGEKAVVFSQHRAAVEHTSLALSRQGVGHVTICRGEPHRKLEQAVATWADSPDCQAARVRKYLSRASVVSSV